MDLLGPTCGTVDRLALHAQHPLPIAEELPAFAEPAECIPHAALARQQGADGSYTETRETTHFLMAWDPSNTVLDAATLDTTAAALETSWDVEVTEHGWNPPDQTDTCLITVLLVDLSGADSGTGGWTDVNEVGGVPYIVLNTDWFAESDDWTETLVAHEFNHASQFAYGVFNEEEDWWYWESTAEWSTELVFPEANAWNYSLWAYFDNPGYAWKSQRGLVNYGHFTFNIVLTEQVDEAAPLLTWQAATADGDVPTALTTALDTDLDALLLTYTEHAAAMDVAERDAWIDTEAEFEVDPYTLSLAKYPAHGSRNGKSAPEGRGQNFVHLAGDPGGDLLFEFTGDNAADGADPRWAVTLSTLAEDGTFTHSSQLAEGGATSVRVSDLGAGVTDAYLGVIPLADVGETPVGWSYTVASAQGHDPEPVACGCSAGEGSAAAGAGIAGLVAVMGRRRHRG